MNRVFSLMLAAAVFLSPTLGWAAQDAEAGGGAAPTSWQHVPDAEQFLRYYPERAMNLGVEGRASIRCSVTEAGTLVDCSVVSETPTGYEFGVAALKLSALFKMKPKLDSGQSPVRSQVTVPIAFRLANERQPADDAIMTAHAYWATQAKNPDLEEVRPAGVAEGYALLQCHIKEGVSVAIADRGKLIDCKVVKSSISSLGAAALKLVPMFQLSAPFGSVASVDSIVQFSLVWPKK